LSLSPGPRGLPLVGHVPAFARDRLGFLSSCAATYGDVVRLHLGRPTWLLTGADDLRHVLVTRPAAYGKSDRIAGRLGSRLLGRGLLTSGGRDHRRQRRSLTPVFQRDLLGALGGVTMDVVAERLGTWRAGETIDLRIESRAIAQRVMLQSLFGRGGLSPAVVAAVDTHRRHYERTMTAPAPFGPWTWARWRLRHRPALRVIEAALLGAVADRRRRDVRDDLLSMLAALRDEGGELLPDDQVVQEALSYINAGYETVAASIAWTWMLLATHPECLLRIADEVSTAFGAAPPAVDSLPALPYTRMVVSESLRLYPPAWMFVRMALEDDRLPSGVSIAKGEKLVFCPYATHRNPRYFEEPLAFRPERFAGDEHSRPRLSYLPFGAGPYTCVGEPLARAECALVIAAVAQRFRLVPAPSRLVVEASTVLRAREGLRVSLESRTNR
jgi:cytochrome P450